MKKEITIQLKTIFKGFGQIMLQENSLTGALFFVAILYYSPLMAFYGLIANIVANLVAKLLQCNNKDIESGLYGFNASLIGFAITFYFQANVWVAITVITASALSSVLMKYALQYKLPAYTFPFVLLTWISLLLLSIPELALPTVPEHFVDIEDVDDFLIEGHAFGQVIFQGSFWAGVIFFIGVFVSSPIAALYAFVSVVISIFISHNGGISDAMIREGVFSFNAVLCGIAMSGPKVKDGLYVLIAVTVATYVDIILIDYGWAALTFPFVLSMWVIYPIKKLEENCLKKLH